MIAREPLITSGFIKKIALFNFEKGLGRPWGVDVLQTALQSGTGSGTGLVYNSLRRLLDQEGFIEAFPYEEES